MWVLTMLTMLTPLVLSALLIARKGMCLQDDKKIR